MPSNLQIFQMASICFSMCEFCSVIIKIWKIKQRSFFIIHYSVLKLDENWLLSLSFWILKLRILPNVQFSKFWLQRYPLKKWRLYLKTCTWFFYSLLSAFEHSVMPELLQKDVLIQNYIYQDLTKKIQFFKRWSMLWLVYLIDENNKKENLIMTW